MARIADYTEATATFLKEQGQEFLTVAKKLVVNDGFLPAEATSSDTLYIDVSPGDRHGETVEQRRTRTRHERNAVHILVRKKLPEKAGKDRIAPLMAVVERIGDLLLDASWGDGVHCASIDATAFDPDALAAGLFSAAIVAHIESKWDY
jgi:hypothetical protein